MKKKNIVIALICVMWVACISTSTYATSVYLDLLEDKVVAGDIFSVEVYATDVNGKDLFGFAEEIISFGFDIVFDDTAFSLIDSPVASDFWDDSSLFTETAVAGSVFPGPGPTGNDILLATLNFKAEEKGIYSLAIVSDINDDNEGLITTITPELFNPFSKPIDMTSSISVNVAPVPEPSTVLLFGVGIAALAGVRRKKR